MGRPSKYPEQFRREAVQLVVESGRARADVARSLGVPDNTLRNWLNADRAERQRGSSHLTGSRRDGGELGPVGFAGVEEHADAPMSKVGHAEIG